MAKYVVIKEKTITAYNPAFKYRLALFSPISLLFIIKNITGRATAGRIIA